MAKLDRLVWTAGMAFRAYGVNVGVRVNDAELLKRLPDFLPPGWKATESDKVDQLYSLIAGGAGGRQNVRRFSLLYSNMDRVARSMDTEDVLQSLESHLKLYVAENAPRRVFIHAGVVGWKGKAIVIPGKSFSGKTTLVAEFVRAGATYYSDEYAVMDAHGRVHPYSRPLAVRSDEDVNTSKKLAAAELGGRTGVGPLPVGLVLLSQFEDGAKWKPRSLSPGQGAMALLDNTISIRRRPEAAFDVFERVLLKTPVLRGLRGEAHEIVGSILKSVG